MEINPGICLLNGDTRLVLEMPASLAAQQDEAAGLCRQYWNIDVNPEWKQSETALPQEELQACIEEAGCEAGAVQSEEYVKKGFFGF
jgi:hypothetical protein